MENIKNSSFLESVLSRAKGMASTLTAELFLVALIEMLEDASSADPEIAETKNLLSKYPFCMESARALAEKKKSSPLEDSLSDGIYMQKKLDRAKTQASEKGLTAITTTVLLGVILEDPSASIRSLMESTETHETPLTSGGSSLVAALDSMLGKKSSSAGGVEKDHAEADDETVSSPQDSMPVEKDPKRVREDMDALVADVKRIRTELQNEVFGQDHAISVFMNGYFQARMLAMTDHSRTRPQATFLFAGPSGVGKTLLAEKAARSLHLPFMRFDMSEYADKEANLEFCGSDKVYKGAKAGNVTEFVSKNPQCVLLFDEIEKAHITVIHLFLQMLDAGRLRDNFTDKEVSFTNAIIILTTNAGKQLYTDSEIGNLSTVPRKVIIHALEKDVNPETNVPYFPGAICSRFASGNVVMFNHIGAHDLHTIAKKEIGRHIDNIEKKTGIRFEIDERVYTALLLSEGSKADARTIRARSESFIMSELHELLRMLATDKAHTSLSTITMIRIGTDLFHAKTEVTSLFENHEKTRLLVLASDRAVCSCSDALPSMDIVGVHTLSEAIGVIKNQEFDCILLDMCYGIAEGMPSSLNVEDLDSPARDFFKFLRDNRLQTPVYLLEEKASQLDEEDIISFMRQGMRGAIRLSDGTNALRARITSIAQGLYQQASMNKLAKENKLITFETAQTVTADGSAAQILLFDFETRMAVDSEDAGSILSGVSKPNVKFDDVLGAKDAKKELTYFVEYLRNPKKYMGTGVKAPRGILLYGPPGTGKTMLAKAMACEAGVTFLAAEGNQFLKRYVGEGPEAVHELFRTARKYAPSILFIDEIDAIAKERRGSDGSGAVAEEILTAFLTEMDGFVSDTTRPVFVLAATNFDIEPGSAKSLDPALMRRFDRRIYIDLPDKADRIRFLNMAVDKNKALELTGDMIDNIAMRSTGMSLAQLDSVVELALRSAIRDGSTKVTDAIFEEAFETFNSGDVKKWDPSQLRRVAYHEAGHAFLCWQSGETPSYLTIVARGSHGGYMQHADNEGKAIVTKDELLARIRTSLGGRASEIVFYGDRDGISTGASGDLSSATKTAYHLICTYGMDESFGLASLSALGVTSETAGREVREAINRLLKEQMELAIASVRENAHKINALVEVLLVKNHMLGTEIDEILKNA